MKQRIVLDVAADRGAYIDHSQSLNIHMIDATTAKLSSRGRIRIIEEEVEDEDADASAILKEEFEDEDVAKAREWQLALGLLSWMAHEPSCSGHQQL